MNIIILNKHFGSVGQNVADEIPDSHVNFTEYLRDINIKDSIFFTSVTQEEIENGIMLTPSNISFGLYSSAQLFKS